MGERPRNKTTIKVLQTNLQKQRAAHDMAYLITEREGIDIIIASEPNKTLMKNPRWITDKKLDVAAFFQNKNLQVSGIDKYEGFIKIQFKTYDIYCCYCSPNIPLDEFKIYIDILMNTVRQDSREAIILGDLNVKSTQWGSPVTDNRGEYFTEWTAMLDMIIHNSGDKPTFVRGASKSYIDVTSSTQGIARDIANWKVLDDEPISDHSFIYFEIHGRLQKTKQKTERQKVFFDKVKFHREVKNKTDILKNVNKVSVQDCMDTLNQTYKWSCLGRNTTQSIKVPFWWNEEIETKRSECIRLRRKLTRQRIRTGLNNAQIDQLRDEYKQERHELKKLINKSKKQHWQDLCNELDNNLWGNGYRIAVKHLKNPSLPYNLTDDKKQEIGNGLFPNKEDYWEKGNAVSGVEEFTLEELIAAGNKMKSGKAPGPDNIPPEAVKEMINAAPEFLLDVLNGLLRTQEFPERWKIARVILLWKSGKPLDNISSFRPICLLDTLGKLYEIMIRERLEKELENSGGLSNQQYGFRKGRSTIQAVMVVLDTIRQSKEKWCTLITLDVKNAFNTATWSYIIEELHRRSIPRYMINLIESYFEDRKLKIAGSERQMTVGVPQGSVLGPTLWNILYDGVLEQDLGEDVMAICFADDLAILVKAETKENLIFKANEALRRTDVWMANNDLELAPEKTEAVILKGKWNTSDIKFRLKETVITPTKAVKYLGIVLGSHGTFKDHINQVIKKAEERIASLSQLMPNIGGPRSAKRAVMSGVTHSILLYGAPVWHQVMKTKLYQEKMERVQRKILLRVASAYRTASSKALQVITGIAPIELQVEERTYTYKPQEDRTEAKKNARERTLTKWQQMWEENDTKGQWTKRLIPNIKTWVKCQHRSIEYYTTQVLTGHGSFKSYTKRFGITTDDNCIYCAEVDTAEHTLFTCTRWERWRQDTYMTLGYQLNPENLINKMIESEGNWREIQTLIRKIMKTKETDRNERQRQQR